MIKTILRAIGVGTGIASVVLSVMEVINERDAVKLIGIGLSCLAISTLNDNGGEE